MSEGGEMNAIDWDAKAVLQRRDDAGSDMFVQFDTIDEGPLGAMVRRVQGMPPGERARVVLDVTGRGMLTVAEIMALASRPDLPPA